MTEDAVISFFEDFILLRLKLVTGSAVYNLTDNFPIFVFILKTSRKNKKVRKKFKEEKKTKNKEIKLNSYFIGLVWFPQFRYD